MPIQPLFDRILVKRKEQARTTASGLILPDAGQENEPRHRYRCWNWKRRR